MTAASPTAGTTFRIVSLISVAHMMSHVYHQSLHPLFPTLTGELGVTYTALGLLMTSFSIATALGQIPIGFLVDRIGGRIVLIVGLALQASSVGALALTDSYWAMFALFTLAGLAHSVYHPADYAILSDTIDKSRLARAFTLHSSTGNVGNLLGPLVIVGVAEIWGWRSACLAVGLVGIAVSLIVWSQGSVLDSTRRARSVAAQPAASIGDGLRLLFSGPLLMCFLFFIVLTMAFSGVRIYTVSAVHEIYGVSPAVATMVLTGLTVGIIVGMLTGGYVADRYGPRISIAVFGLIAAALLLVVVGWAAVPIALAGALLTTAGFMRGFVQGVRDLMVHAATPEGAHGKTFGFVSTGSHVGHAIMPLLFGGAMDSGRPEWVFGLGAALSVAALLTFVTVRRKIPGS